MHNIWTVPTRESLLLFETFSFFFFSIKRFLEELTLLKIRDVQQEREETIFLQVIIGFKKIKQIKYQIMRIKKQIWDVKYQVSSIQCQVSDLKSNIKYDNSYPIPSQILSILYQVRCIRIRYQVSDSKYNI